MFEEELSLPKQLEVQRFINIVRDFTDAQLDEAFHIVYPTYQTWTNLNEQISIQNKEHIDFNSAMPSSLHMDFYFNTKFKSLSPEDKRLELANLYKTALIRQEQASQTLVDRVKSAFSFLKFQQ